MITTQFYVPDNLHSLNLEFNKVNVKVITGKFPSVLFKNCTDKMFDSSFTDGEWVIKEKRKLSFAHLGHT